MKTKIILFFLLLSFSALNAQVKHGNNKNLSKLFVDEKWEDLAFKTERMILQDKYVDDAEVLLYLAYSYNKVFLICLENPDLLTKYPEYINSYQLAINYSQQAKRKDKKAKVFFPDNDSLLEEIVISGFYYIDNYVNVKKKYPKANSLLNKMMKAYSDDNILFLKGVLTAMTNNDVQAKEIFDTVYNRLANSANKRTSFYAIEAFDYYTHFLVNKENPDIDSAKNVVEKALSFYPDNEVILYLSEYVNNPQTDKIKPANKKRLAILKDINSIKDDDEEDDNVTNKNKKAKKSEKNDD